MNKVLSEQPVRLFQNQSTLLLAVAEALMERGPEPMAGFDGIEYREYELFQQSSSEDTVFGAIGEELTKLGLPGDYGTVGGVMEGLGYATQKAAKDAAHDIGCYCHEDNITAEMAASRMKQMARQPGGGHGT